MELRSGLDRLLPILRHWRAPAVPALAGVTLAVGLISTILALWVPPNSADAVSYHLSRVGYYLQFRSLDHYPTVNLRQVTFPANAELLILWAVAFLRSDRLANTVQLAAWAMTTAAVYGLGRQVRLGARAALVGAGAFALLPQVVIQSTAADNDLIVASFAAACAFFLLEAAGASSAVGPSPRTWLAPRSALVLAGAAAGLALGTKGTALLILPGLAGLFLVVLGRRPERSVVAGLLLGGLAAATLGGYVYAQNWSLYGSPLGSPSFSVAVPALSWQAFTANLGRNLHTFVFADLSGPLADRRAAPVAVPLAQALGAVGERLFAILGVASAVPGFDLASWPPFAFVRRLSVGEYSSGYGPIGGLIVAITAAVLVWPNRLLDERRLLAATALSYLVALSATLMWSLTGSGRYLVTCYAIATPLISLVAERAGRWRRALTLVVVAWSAATGLYTAWFNEHKPVPRVAAGPDRIELSFPGLQTVQAFFREADEHLGSTATVAVYGFIRPDGSAGQMDYPFFGPRFERTVVPLVDAGYAERVGLRRPLGWTNERLLAAYRPTFLAVWGPRPAAEELPEILPGRCTEVPLRHGKPAVWWELWHCDDWETTPRERPTAGTATP